MEIDNIVIECLNKEHGKEIISFFKKLCANASFFKGNYTLEDNNKYRFYGVIDGKFDCYSFDQVISSKAIIIPTGHFKEREMMVSFDNKYIDSYKRKVIGKYMGKYIVLPNHDGSIDSYGILWLCDYAKEIQPKTKITRKEFEEKYEIID